jgi:hypothetical protein
VGAGVPNGNKRTALLCTIRFAGMNRFRSDPPPGDERDGAETARIVEATAAGSMPLEEFRDWISDRLELSEA